MLIPFLALNHHTHHGVQFMLHIHTHKQSPSNDTPVAQVLSALSGVSCLYVHACVCVCAHVLPGAHQGDIHNCLGNNDRRFYWVVRDPLVLY